MQTISKNRGLKAAAYSIFALIIALFIAGCDTQQPDRYELTLPTIEGDSITLKEHRDKWLVINYWASWCKPCYTEIPELNNLAAAHPDKITLLGVSYDLASDEEKQELAAKMEIAFPTLAVDPAAELGIDSVAALPATYIFHPDGHLVESLVGEQTQADLEKIMGLNANGS